MFNNKVALVTGASGGIGEAIIRELASKNCNVIIHYNENEKQAIELQSSIEKDYQVKSMIIKCDIKEENQVQDMTNKIIREFGKIDILVNNAALEINNDFFDKKKEDFLRVLEVNLIGTFLVSKYVGQKMVENKYGKIINITSNNAINKYDPSTLEYDASKAGIISLTHNLAVEYAPYINVNAVAPGWVLTKKVKELNDSLDGMLELEEKKNILLDRFASPLDIAHLVSFLASDEASYINNEIIKIDGGTR